MDGNATFKVPRVSEDQFSFCGRNLRSISKAEQAGVWMSLFLKGGAGREEKKLVLGKLKEDIEVVAKVLDPEADKEDYKDISEEVYDVKGEYSFWMDGEKLNQSMGGPRRKA